MAQLHVDLRVVVRGQEMPPPALPMHPAKNQLQPQLCRAEASGHEDRVPWTRPVTKNRMARLYFTQDGYAERSAPA